MKLLLLPTGYNTISELVTECKSRGWTSPITINLRLVQIIYWYNDYKDGEPWFSVHRFKWHLGFHFGSVTIGF